MTFGEWYASTPRGYNPTLTEAFQAGAASRDAEVTNLAALGSSYLNRANAAELELDQLRQQLSDHIKREMMLRNALNKMNRAYVTLIENARDRIITLGGDCDPVDVMERADPNLLESREALAATEPK